jgi:hypothetical protein
MFSVPWGEHFPGGGFAQKPFERVVAAAPCIGGVSDPIVMHVERERRCRCVLRESTRLATHLHQIHPEPAELLGHRQQQVARGAWLLEIVFAKLIIPVVFGCALATASRSCESTELATTAIGIPGQMKRRVSSYRLKESTQSRRSLQPLS